MKNVKFKEILIYLNLFLFLTLFSCNNPQPINLNTHATLGRYGCDHNITETLNSDHLLKRTIISNNLKFHDVIVHPTSPDSGVPYPTVYVDIDRNKFNTINDSLSSHYKHLKQNNIPINPDSLKVGFNGELSKFLFWNYLADSLTVYYGAKIIYGK